MAKIESEAGVLAAESIVDILESYMEFVSAVEYALNFADMPYKIEVRLEKMVKERRKQWEPILKKVKTDLEAK